ncbi:hypothetical protein K440DRAFT_646620 [Wilcoxina mikolae CBS 423.85]|nr:hypothetical protein K440DRAFT_646620 [Wilcoxina mikolae CBS 423.85]
MAVRTIMLINIDELCVPPPQRPGVPTLEFPLLGDEPVATAPILAAADSDADSDDSFFDNPFSTEASSECHPQPDTPLFTSFIELWRFDKTCGTSSRPHDMAVCCGRAYMPSGPSRVFEYISLKISDIYGRHVELYPPGKKGEDTFVVPAIWACDAIVMVWSVFMRWRQ